MSVAFECERCEVSAKFPFPFRNAEQTRVINHELRIPNAYIYISYTLF